MIQKVHIIAEAGTNHNGRIEKAKNLVDMAVDAGADSVKFQIIYPEGLYLPRLFQEGQYIDNKIFHKRKAMMLSDDDYRVLADYCKEREIAFSASIFDRRGIDLADELGVSYIKTASCDLNNSRLLIEAAKRGRRLVISTGMSSLGEIDRAVSDVIATGNTDIVLMHCVSVYPCSIEHMNLGMLDVLKRAFRFPIGLSDHTESNLAAVMAIVMGATWIEKHITVDRKAEGFDHAYAMEHVDFAGFVKDVRMATEACRRKSMKLQPDEVAVKRQARRSLYVARDIQEGAILSEDDILVVRPEGLLNPNDLPLILGRVVKRRLYQYEPLSLDHFF